MADEGDIKPAAASSQTVPRGRDPQFRDIYSNASFFTMGPFDVTITFSKMMDVAGQQMVIDQGAVSFSPQHFKSFCLSVNETLKAWEKVFGELQIPASDIQPPFRTDQLVQRLEEARKQSAAVRAALNAATSASSSNEPKRPSRRSRAAAKA